MSILSKERIAEITGLHVKETSFGQKHGPAAYSTVYSWEIVELAKMVEALTSQLESVVAENAALKSKAAELVHEASEVYSAYNSTITEPDGDFMDMQTLQEMQSVETPATDAFLAEVSASGVDQWIASRDGRWNGTTKEAERFAASIRQGGAV
ncbi:MAG: hypothetical protein LKI85_09240 [Enterobacter sp.]|jgi:hypothetical protein|nr:hypothetical protein [Enterobacter sp.]